eukprot:316764_1
MTATLSLRLQLIQKHQEAIEELESRYLSFITKVLQQKKNIIVEMQKKFYEQMENIHNLDKNYNINIKIVQPNDNSSNSQISTITPNFIPHDNSQDNININITNNHSVSQLSTPSINPSMPSSNTNNINNINNFNAQSTNNIGAQNINNVNNSNVQNPTPIQHIQHNSIQHINNISADNFHIHTPCHAHRHNNNNTNNTNNIHNRNRIKQNDFQNIIRIN